MEPLLPTLGRRNPLGAWLALDSSLPALALLGEHERCGALYPAALAYIDTGLVSFSAVATANPHLVAGIAAHAAGLHDKAREHFEIATRQARDLPRRLLQPTVLYWYGRALSGASDESERLRGRAMIEAALADFRTLEMVTHANLAERFLRSQ